MRLASTLHQTRRYRTKKPQSPRLDVNALQGV